MVRAWFQYTNGPCCHVVGYDIESVVELGN